MSKVRVVMLALFATVALSAVGAASASANWMAGGKDVPAGTTVAITLTTTLHEVGVLDLPNLGIQVSCTGVDIEGGYIIGGTNNGFVKSLKFLGCKISKPEIATCVLSPNPATIETNPILAKATLFGNLGARILFSPETKTEFAFIPFAESNTCGLAGEQPVTGRVTLAAPTARDEQLLQGLEGLGATENNSLQVGSGNQAFLLGGLILLRLVTDSKWSVL